jgi:hypothetical protein
VFKLGGLWIEKAGRGGDSAHSVPFGKLGLLLQHHFKEAV